MPLFRNFEECKRIVSLMLEDFTEEGRLNIENTILYCQQLDSDADKKFALTRSVKKQLWDIPKAVDMGFVEYLKERVNHLRILIEYEKVNNDE